MSHSACYSAGRLGNASTRTESGKTPMHAGAATPMHGSQTPMYGSKTPMYGSQTPMHDGSRTPHYGSQTPLHEGGLGSSSRTPSGSSAWDPTSGNTPARYVQPADTLLSAHNSCLTGIFTCCRNSDYDYGYDGSSASPAPSYNPATPGYQADVNSPAAPYTPGSYSNSSGFSPYQGQYMLQVDDGSCCRCSTFLLLCIHTLFSVSPGYGASGSGYGSSPSPLSYSPMTPGTVPYTPGTPGMGMLMLILPLPHSVHQLCPVISVTLTCNRFGFIWCRLDYV